MLRINLPVKLAFVGALTCVTALLSVPSYANYQVLVLNKDGAKQSTYWCDGLASKHVEQIIVFWNGHLDRLYTQNFSEHVSCPNGKFPFFYQVDKLLSEGLASHASKVLLGDDALASAKDVLRDHQASCEGMKPLPYEPDTQESYEKTSINVLSFYDDLLGVEQLTESYSYGRPQPLISLDWSLYRLDKTGLTKVKTALIPSSVTAKAQMKFSHLPAKEKEAYGSGDFSHYIARPLGAGMAVDFAMLGVQDPARKSIKTVEVEKENGFAKAIDAKKAMFVVQHEKLLDWKRLSVYDVAPDNSAVVYVKDNVLYWLTPGNAPVKIGEVKEVDGIQWFNVTAANIGDLHALK
jgi:hypothetical protein